jgi:hypothetical protein
MRKDIVMVEDAIKMAKEIDPQCNCYQEYQDAYFFFDNTAGETIGGEACGFVIMKKGGQKKMPYEYFMNPSSKVKEIGGEIEIKG